MAAHDACASGARDVHHCVPQCLLRLYDRADGHQEFDGEGIQLWLDYEVEALRFGVDPDLSREKLAALVDGSKVLVPREEHRLFEVKLAFWCKDECKYRTAFYSEKQKS